MKRISKDDNVMQGSKQTYQKVMLQDMATKRVNNHSYYHFIISRPNLCKHVNP